VFEKLLAMLDEGGATYRVIEHPEEGRTDVVSGYRGNDLAAAAKCIVVMVKVGKKVTRYFSAVVAGDARLHLNAVKSLVDGTYVSFASTDKAEALAGSVSGTILPFSFT
jgi:Ala-tRNA(Pro) deacylase